MPNKNNIVSKPDLVVKRRILQAAIERELTRLLAEKGLPPKMAQGARIPSLPVELELKGKTSPDKLGKMLANAIYGQLYSAQ